MHLEEMQLVWDAQKNQELYAINRESLRRLVARESIAIQRDLAGLELGAMVTCVAVALVTVLDTFFNGEEYFQLVSAVVQLAAAGWLWLRRRRRESSLARQPVTLLQLAETAIQRATATIQRGRDLCWFFTVIVLYGVIVRVAIYGWQGSEVKALLGIAGIALLHLVFRLTEKKTHAPRLRSLEKLKSELRELE